MRRSTAGCSAISPDMMRPGAAPYRSVDEGCSGVDADVADMLTASS
jgi:hypothetical protein